MSDTLALKVLYTPRNIFKDLLASLVVFFVALPLCLGIALASGAPLASGLIAGMVGGIVIGFLSGSHTSVSGPAAGLTAIMTAQIAALGSFEALLLAVCLAGVIQIGMGLAKAGELSAFFPTSVINGLLAAIGVIIILKQIPHLLGHDSDPEGEMSYEQPDGHTTFSELETLFHGDFHTGAAIVGISCLALLLIWKWIPYVNKQSALGPLVVVIIGVVLQFLFGSWGGSWGIESSHLVQIPVASSASGLAEFFAFPDFSRWADPAIYLAAVTIALVASLETLLNLEAVEKLDPENRSAPPSRELLAQGTGNLIAGFIGGLPMTSVIIRSSVNVNSGAKTKLSAIFHGFLLLLAIFLLPTYLNFIPLAALAAILIATGLKLASPKLFVQMWKGGIYQFIPFVVTLGAIVYTDLLIGILIGLGVSLLFILNSNLRRPIRRIVETHLEGTLLHIELAQQVSFLNRAALLKLFHEAKPGSHVLVDASETDYIDPDILSVIREFKETTGPARDVTVSLKGFKTKYQLGDEILFADYSSRELQDRMTPQQVLEVLREGNKRFISGQPLKRDLVKQVGATSAGQNPLAVILSCIDSRVPAELVFDLGIGDIFSVRVAGNIIGTKSLGSIEYGVVVARVKLVVVLGHTRCGAVTSSVKFIGENLHAEQETGCSHLCAIVDEIGQSVPASECRTTLNMTNEAREEFVNDVAWRNVARTVQEIKQRSGPIREAVDAGKVLVVGAMYDVNSGDIEFLSETGKPVAVG